MNKGKDVSDGDIAKAWTEIMSAYAERIGEQRSAISYNRNAYKVYKHCLESVTRVTLLRLLDMNAQAQGTVSHNKNAYEVYDYCRESDT